MISQLITLAVAVELKVSWLISFPLNQILSVSYQHNQVFVLLFINRMRGLYREILSPRFEVRKKRGLSISRYGTSHPVNK